MLGFRGAGRYASPQFQRAFQLECRAIKRVRDEMGLTNVEIMLPFVRTLGDADAALAVLAENGLERGSGKDGLKIIMMCEIPANVLMADEFLQRFDGFSIGSNDLTQLTLGVDRDSSLVAAAFDETVVRSHRRLQAPRQVRRHLRSGTLRSPRPGRMAGGSGHRLALAQPGHGGEHLAAPGGARKLGAVGGLTGS